MSAHGKTIRIFLPDGDPHSIRIAYFTSQTVRVTHVPRHLVDLAKDRDEVRGVGIYLLFDEGKRKGKPSVYIGESEHCYVRLKQHVEGKGKKPWTHAVIVTSKDETFDKAQALWLEWHATQLAKSVGRYGALNQCAAKEPHMLEHARADLFGHFDTIRVLVELLGYPVFKPISPLPPDYGSIESDSATQPHLTKSAAKEHLVLFYCSGIKGGSARGYLVDGGFLILAGSTARRSVAASFSTYDHARRGRMMEQGLISDDGDAIRFVKDTLFPTPSGASKAVQGRSSNGWTAWKTKSGQTLKNWASS